jgi:hypothetical protein
MLIEKIYTNIFQVDNDLMDKGLPTTGWLHHHIGLHSAMAMLHTVQCNSGPTYGDLAVQ